MTEVVDNQISNSQSPLSEQCPICKGMRAIETEKGWAHCQCVIDGYKFRRVGVLWQSDLKTYKSQTANQKKVVEAVSVIPTKSYMFVGDVGTGKTYFMASLFNTVCNTAFRKVEWTNDYSLKQNFVDVEMKEVDIGIVDKIKSGTIKHLFWDDIGKAKISDTYLQGVFQLVDTCLIVDCKLCITSCINLDKIQEIYGNSITRRIEQIMFKIFDMGGGK